MGVEKSGKTVLATVYWSTMRWSCFLSVQTRFLCHFWDRRVDREPWWFNSAFGVTAITLLDQWSEYSLPDFYAVGNLINFFLRVNDGCLFRRKIPSMKLWCSFGHKQPESQTFQSNQKYSGVSRSFTTSVIYRLLQTKWMVSLGILLSVFDPVIQPTG